LKLSHFLDLLLILRLELHSVFTELIQLLSQLCEFFFVASFSSNLLAKPRLHLLGGLAFVPQTSLQLLGVVSEARQLLLTNRKLLLTMLDLVPFFVFLRLLCCQLFLKLLGLFRI